jgi:hypothetical protein
MGVLMSALLWIVLGSVWKGFKKLRLYYIHSTLSFFLTDAKAALQC